MSGGLIENPSGFRGKIICPDYNSVCTSEIWCNDPLDCIDKEVKADETSYHYTYPLPSNFDLNSSFMLNLSLTLIFMLIAFII